MINGLEVKNALVRKREGKLLQNHPRKQLVSIALTSLVTKEVVQPLSGLVLCVVDTLNLEISYSVI